MYAHQRTKRDFFTYASKATLMFLIGVLALPVFAQDDPVARILKTNGDVMLRKMAEMNYDTQVAPAQPLFPGDAIRVGDASYVALLFIDDKSLVKVKANSEFQIVETANTRTMNLDYGSMRSTLPQPVKDFRVETPVSVASVKGTDFWLIHDAAAGIDKAYGIEGIVEVFNQISGLSQLMTANTMIISTATGTITPPVPVSPDEFPDDPEGIDEPETQPDEGEAEPEGETETGEAEPETGETVPSETVGVVTPDVEQPAADEEGEGEAEEAAEAGGPGMGLGLGSVTIDGQVFYQIALRPEFKFRKIGVGLDLVGYMDAQGNFRKDEWDEPSDYLDKIYYLRYGTEQDPFFLRIGAMPQVQYGFGGLMSNYSNMTEYPQVRRVGFEIGGHIKQNFTLKGFTADLKEMGGLVGMRGTYRVAKAFPLTLGINIVSDLNQYGGLKDYDDDNIPDMVDDFPHDKKWSVDSDGDGLADADLDHEFDIDGDGWTDQSNDPLRPNNDLDGITRKPDPFSTKTHERSISGFSVDLSYPILSRKLISLTAYTEFARLSYADTLTSTVLEDGTTESAESGTGIIGPGLQAQLFKFLSLNFEYRKTSALYQPGFFNMTYDFERAQFTELISSTGADSMGVTTKDQASINNAYGMSGFYGGAAANLFNVVTFGASYQKLTPATDDTTAKESNSFIANLSLNTDFVPKLSKAVAYYIRTNDDNPFDFEHPSNNTTWGYSIGYEIATGVDMIYNLQVSYRGEEEIRLLTVETAFRF